jgi:hypothetical protein
VRSLPCDLNLVNTTNETKKWKINKIVRGPPRQNRKAGHPDPTSPLASQSERRGREVGSDDVHSPHLPPSAVGEGGSCQPSSLRHVVTRCGRSSPASEGRPEGDGREGQRDRSVWGREPHLLVRASRRAGGRGRVAMGFGWRGGRGRGRGVGWGCVRV